MLYSLVQLLDRSIARDSNRKISNTSMLGISSQSRVKFQEEDIPSIIRKLADHFNQQNESAVRVKILSIFRSICRLPGADPAVSFIQNGIHNINMILSVTIDIPNKCDRCLTVCSN